MTCKLDMIFRKFDWIFFTFLKLCWLQISFFQDLNLKRCQRLKKQTKENRFNNNVVVSFQPNICYIWNETWILKRKFNFVFLSLESVSINFRLEVLMRGNPRSRTTYKWCSARRGVLVMTQSWRDITDTNTHPSEFYLLIVHPFSVPVIALLWIKVVNCHR